MRRGFSTPLFSSVDVMLLHFWVCVVCQYSEYSILSQHSVLDWQRRLVLMLETLEHWVHCQKKWLYLESIFTAVDIQR